MTQEKSFESSALARARRRRAVEFGVSSFALEDINISEQHRTKLEKWVDGEITDEAFERMAGIRK